MFIATVWNNLPAPAERYVRLSHIALRWSARICHNVSINIALRWSAAFFVGFPRYGKLAENSFFVEDSTSAEQKLSKL